MAEKRMFTNRITGSDPFKEMPLSAQALYFHLGMSADDEGFLNNAKSVQRSILASDDDMKLLIAKNFIIPFESGVVAIKHWKMHNTIQPSRLKETQYTEERSLLSVKENKAYTLDMQGVSNLSADCQQNANTCCQNTAEIRLEEIRLDKSSLEEDMPDSDEPEPPAPDKKPVKHKYGEYQNVLLTDDELQKLKSEYSDFEDRIERLSSYVASTGKRYKSHYATIRNWARKDAEKKPVRKEMVPKWATKEQNSYDIANLEEALLANGTKTVDSDPALKARADALREELANR